MRLPRFFPGTRTAALAVSVPWRLWPTRQDPEKALQEVFRVLKPGAHAVFHEYEHVATEVLPQQMQKTFLDINEYSAMPAYQRFSEGGIPKFGRKKPVSKISVLGTSQSTFRQCWDYSLTLSAQWLEQNATPVYRKDWVDVP